MKTPTIKDANHLNELLCDAESDDELRAIVQQMQRQGLFIPKDLRGLLP